MTRMMLVVDFEADEPGQVSDTVAALGRVPRVLRVWEGVDTANVLIPAHVDSGTAERFLVDYLDLADLPDDRLERDEAISEGFGNLLGNDLTILARDALLAGAALQRAHTATHPRPAEVAARLDRTEDER